jgi:HEAT repeat protein
MSQIPTKKVLKLLDADQPAEVRCAAAMVLGEVGVRNAEVAKALRECLDDEAPAVRLQAIRAAGKLRMADVLPRLLERVKDGGEEAHEAVEAAARLGPKGSKALQELMPRVAPGVRRIIAAAVAAEGAASGSDTSLSVLLDHDHSVVEGAVRSLSDQIPTLDAAHRDGLGEQLVRWLGDRKAKLPPFNEAAVVRLLAALGDARAVPLLWDRIVPPASAEIRAAALQGLGPAMDTPTKEQLKRLLACAADRDFRVAAPALMILKKLPVAEKAASEWLTLFDTPDVAARRLALEKLGERDKADVADALLRQLRHPDRSLREAALACLSQLKHGRDALTTALLEAATPDEAWTLARTLIPIARDFPASWRQQVFGQACAYLEADDRRSESLLFLLRETDAHDLRERLEERALYWRKKKDYTKALHYLRLLGRDPAVGFPIRLELAACGLKVSEKDLSADARVTDPCLHQFVRLCEADEAAVLTAIKESKWLEPDDLYYLGFHLSEQQGRPRQCAADILKLVVSRSPRSKLAQAAKSKLKSSGLG